MNDGSEFSGTEVTDHQVIFRAGHAEAVVVSLEEYRALKALEQREADSEAATGLADHRARIRAEAANVTAKSGELLTWLADH